MKHGLMTTVVATTLVLLSGGCDQILPVKRQVAIGPPADTARTEPPPARRRRAAAPAPADTVSVGEDEAFNLIRRGLRRLVAAEQAFYAENGAYSEDFERLRFKPEGAAEFRFLWVTREGWAASGTHPGLPGRDCVIFVGRVNAAPTSLKYVRTAREGVPACDVTPPPPRRADAPAPIATRATDTGSALDAVNPFVQMRVDLRNLVRAQDAYHATQGSYSRRVEPLQLQFLYQRGVNITVLSANANSWSARASHAAEPGKSCVVWYGPVNARPTTEERQRAPEKPGVPVCDG